MRPITLFLAAASLAACGAQPPAPVPAHFDRAIALEDSAGVTANVSIGDLDGDGDPDMVLARGRHWPVVDRVLLNDGSGGFASAHPLGDIADRTYTAALADLDGDGDLDLVVGNDRPDEKLVYLNDGRGAFERTGSFGEAGWATRNVTVADLDGDGPPEIVVANRGGPDNLSSNFVCANDGGGLFPDCRVLSGESATTIAAGDLDGDGDTDLVVPHRDGGQSYAYLNDGAGAFAEGRPVGQPGSATRAVALGDITGDGRPDLIMGDDERGGLLLFENVGEGVFADPVPLGGSGEIAYSIAVADLNRDGRPDLVVGNDEAPGSILLNRGERRFTTTRFGDGAGSMYGLAVADVTGDGCPDIAAARSGAPSMLYIQSCDQ